MNQVLGGALTAVCWGSADFIASYSGRALGVLSALLGMLVSSALILTGLLWYQGDPFDWLGDGWWMLVAFGATQAIATLFLYQALARGPVSIAAPIVGSYPVFSVLFAIALGLRPSGLLLAAMAVVILGVVVVARCTAHFTAARALHAIPCSHHGRHCAGQRAGCSAS